MKLLFYLKRGTQDKNGKSPVMGRISVGRSMVQFSCKCACTPNLWDSRKQRLVGKSAEAVSVNTELDRLQVSVCKVYEMLLKKSNVSVRAEQVKELIFGLNSGSQGLLHHTDEYIDRFRDRVGIDRSERRLKCLLLFRKHLANFSDIATMWTIFPCKKPILPLSKTWRSILPKKRVLNSTLQLVILLCWHPYSRTYTNGTS